MKIGAGFTKNTEDGKTFISISLDEIIGILFPILKPLVKDYFITLWHVPKESRKNENSPSWDVVINVKKDKTEKQANEEEIPF